MNSKTLSRAADNLGDFMVHIGSATSQLVGYEWEARPDAPTTYPRLREAVQWSDRTGRPLPVNDETASAVAYSSTEAVFAYRFWSDVGHVLRGLDFSPKHRLLLATQQLMALQKAGFGTASVEYRLFEAENIGLIYLSAITGRSTVDQSGFVVRSVEKGITEAIAHEITANVPWEQRVILRPLLVRAR